MYYYWAYGLGICSEIEFPELYPCSKDLQYDIEIVYGQVPRHNNEEKGDEKKGIYIGTVHYKLIVSGVATYWAENGNKIIVEVAEGASLNNVRLFCLSNVFTAILHQRGVIPIHSAAIEVNGRLVMICGQSASGKSTLLAGLISLGFSIFSDDVCVPVYENNEVQMHSSYPMMKFWEDTIDRLDMLEIPNVQLRPDLKKFGFYFHKRFSTRTFVPKLIFFLEKLEQIDEVEIREVKGYELFQYVESNAYRSEYLGAIDLRKEHFDLFSKLAKQVKGFVIKRPLSVDSIDHIKRLVAGLIEQEM